MNLNARKVDLGWFDCCFVVTNCSGVRIKNNLIYPSFFLLRVVGAQWCTLGISNLDSTHQCMSYIEMWYINHISIVRLPFLNHKVKAFGRQKSTTLWWNWLARYMELACNVSWPKWTMNFLTCLGDSNSRFSCSKCGESWNTWIRDKSWSGTRVDGCLVSCCFQVLLSILKVSSVCHLR